MSWRKTVPLLLLASNALAIESYVIGVGMEGDTADGLAASAIGDLALTGNTWLTAAVAKSTVDLQRMESVDTWYGDLGVDHFFDPIGIRLGAAYWGDSDILDSHDMRGSLYWRGDRAMIAGNYEYRDFSFDIPPFNAFPGRTIDFDAQGFGLSARFDVAENAGLSLYGMDYDYSVNLRLGDTNRPILDLLSFSRFSLINSLVDYDAGVALGVDAGQQRWLFEFATWKGEVDGSVTKSATVRLTTPIGQMSDVEFGLGVDNSELYGTVTFFSVYLYFYGGP